MKNSALHSARFGIPLSAFPIALILSILLYIQGRMNVLSITVQVVPLSILFALIAASSKYICRALPFRKGPFQRLAAVHLPAALVSAGLWVFFAALLGWGVAQGFRSELSAIESAAELSVVFAVGLIAYLWSVTACYLSMAVEDAIRAENETVASRCLALDAELKALRAKLHPHFLFNSLNSIAALTTIDAARARDMCVYLSDFLRHSLSYSGKREIRLAEELALVRAYLSVEQIRFSEKMTVREHIENGVAGLIVPPLLLQPLAENAVKHGVAGMASDGWIEISISENNGRLLVRMENPVDKDAPKSAGTGHGLAIVRERLRNLFGDAAFLTTQLEDRPPFVFVAELSMPAVKELLS